MPRIERFLFWAGGVLLPRLAESAFEVLSQGREAEDKQAQLPLRNLEKQLALGQISPAEFCQRAAAEFLAPLSAAELATVLQNRVRAAPGSLALLDELAERYPLSLLSDYPPAWLLPSLPQTGLAKRFPRSSILFPQDFRAPSYQALLATLVNLEVIQPGKTLIVDGNPERAQLTVRAGIDVTIFVDSRRLRRDLVLWGLAPEIVDC
jgi:hypothetical protein